MNTYTTTEKFGYHDSGRGLQDDFTIRKTRQGWVYTIIHELSGKLIRINIMRDAYDDQSFADIDVWTTDNGWKQFHRRNIECTPATAVHPYAKLEDINMDLFHRTGEELMHYAIVFFAQDSAA
jgi:hypothetical protein